MSTVTPFPQVDLTATVLGEIKAWMGRRQINQSALAAALGVNQSQLSKRLNGKIALSVVELQQIAAALDVDPAVFVVPSTDPWPSGPHGGGGGHSKAWFTVAQPTPLRPRAFHPARLAA